MSPEPPTTPLEAALDLLVYIPVGMALTVGEEIPKLAAKGRARLGGRIAAARMIGQFAVAQGRKEVDRRIGGDGPPARPARPAPVRPAPAPPTASASATSAPATSAPTTTAPPATPSPATAGPDPAGSAVGAAPDHRAAAAAPEAPAVTPPPPSATSPAEAPDVATLAIPGYASLSASQVVQRLAGLSAAELEAVRLYEASSRGRRTILARVTQLQPR